MIAQLAACVILSREDGESRFATCCLVAYHTMMRLENNGFRA
ncbi:MAG TPA: hypothetical protein VNA69_22350 [Thermoanaerobaculia bacterium]|nr:hypothetical protein [Thermoanaerobaculia bacterium]